MKSNLRLNDKNNMYIKSKRVQSVEKYLDKLQSIRNAVNGAVDEVYTLDEGTKVKLNYESITSEPDYKKKVARYKEFVENNKDTIFTVQYDEKYKNKPILVSLAEDDNEVKWLWHCESDLIVIEDSN